MLIFPVLLTCLLFCINLFYNFAGTIQYEINL